MKWLVALTAVLALLVGVVLGTAGWLLYSESGLRWAAGLAQDALQGRLKLEGLRGALARDIEASSIQFHDEAARVELRDAAVSLELLSILGARAGIRELRAKSLEVSLAPGRSDGKPPAPPRIPLGLRVGRADIERITLALGAQRWIVEGFSLRDAALQQTGAVSAALAFGLRHDQYPVNARLGLGGTIERLEVRFDGRVAEIPAKGRALVTAFAARPLAEIDAQAGPVDLARLNRDWPSSGLTAKLSAKASPANALAGTLSARNSAPGSLDAQRIPLASLDTRFASKDFQSALLQDLKVVLSPGGTLVGKGELGRAGVALDVQVTEFDLRSVRSTLHATRLSGPIHATAGTKQTLQGTLAQDDMRMTADIVRDGDRVEIRSVRAEAHGGAAAGTGSLRLSEPMRFEAKLNLEHFDPARFGRYPSGDINGAFEGSGTLGAQPLVDARWVVRDSMLEGEALESRGAARISGPRISRVVADARLAGARLTARGDFGRAGDELGWALEVPSVEYFLGDISGALSAHGTLTGTFDEPQAALTAEATGLVLPTGMAVKRARAKVSGSLAKHAGELSAQAEGANLAARLRGGWRGDAGWSGELQTLRNSGTFPLELTAPVPVSAARGRVQVGRLEATFAGGHLVVAELAWAEKRLTTSGEFRALPTQWLVTLAGLAEDMRSSLVVDGQWNIASGPRLTGTASVRRTAGDLTLTQGEGGQLALGLEKALLDARFTDGRIDATADIVSRYGSTALKGNIAPEPGAEGLAITPKSALAFTAQVSAAELRAITQPLLEDGRIDGRLAADLRGSGTLGDPKLAGTLRGDGLGFEMPPLGIYLKGGELRAALENDTLRVEQFSIQGGEGRLTATGALPLRLAEGGARLTWRAEKFALLQRPDLRLVASGNGEAQVLDKRLSLTGSLRADRGYFELDQGRMPKLGEDVVIVGEKRPGPREPAKVPVALELQLLQLDLGENLEVRGFGLEGKLRGKLQVQTTKEGELRAYGRIETLNATFFAYGQALQVDPGIIIFDGPLDNPSLQITAWRRKQQVEVGVQVSGNARSPRVQLVSNPPVPEGERLSWLVLGRAPGEATKGDLGILQAAAGALLSNNEGVPLDRQIARRFGLDEISLRGTGEVQDRVVAVGKRLSDRVYISYEQGLGATASQLVKLDFSLTDRIALRAETGTSSGAGILYRFSWD
jgi:translocation and assembly module TamB